MIIRTRSLFEIDLKKNHFSDALTIFCFVCAIPSIVSSIVLYHKLRDTIIYVESSKQLYSIYILSLIICIVVHELGHGAVVVSYRGYTTDVGIITLGIIPLGFFLGYLENTRTPQIGKCLISIAGISLNCAFACVLYLFSLRFPILYIPATFNMIAGITNLIPGRFLDGGITLETMCGIRHLHRKAWNSLIKARFRKKAIDNHRNKIQIIVLFFVAILGDIAAFLMILSYLLIPIFVLF